MLAQNLTYPTRNFIRFFLLILEHFWKKKFLSEAPKSPSRRRFQQDENGEENWYFLFPKKSASKKILRKASREEIRPSGDRWSWATDLERWRKFRAIFGVSSEFDEAYFLFKKYFLKFYFPIKIFKIITFRNAYAIVYLLTNSSRLSEKRQRALEIASDGYIRLQAVEEEERKTMGPMDK